MATTPETSHPGANAAPEATSAPRDPHAEPFHPGMDDVPPGAITPAPLPPDPDAEESLEVWGFRDSGFRVNDRGHVELTGGRYPLSGQELPDLLPWMGQVLQVEIDPHDRWEFRYPPPVPASRATPALRQALAAAVGGAEHVSDDPALRLRRGHGHTQEEMYAIKRGGLPRVPDLVVWPGSTAEVAAAVEAARAHGACVVPYGGGTNVTEALRCAPEEERPIVSLDLRRMSRVLWIDTANRTACIEAGAVGRHIQATLMQHGFTLGHEPDSVEFSTMGGWIATHASGMKKNRYGNIEDLVLDVEAVTAQGVLARSGAAPRESIGLDPRRWLLGSEGSLGIVTRAVVKVFPAPEVQRYGSVLFPDFEAGLAFLEELARAGDLPASVRLMDNLQFQFGQALKPRKTGLGALKSRLEKLYVLKWKGFDPERMVACTLLFEGREEEVSRQEKRTYAIAKRHAGMPAGSENGERGYQLTFGIAYIRDFAMSHWILGESFETSVPWSRAAALCDNVKRRLHQEHAARGLPGKPFVTCRITQLYDTGVCIYFYFAHYFQGVDKPSETYAEMERAARDEILRSGGSLSHHHGVGRLREGFLPRIHSPAGLAWRGEIKRALDPEGVFGATQPS